MKCGAYEGGVEELNDLNKNFNNKVSGKGKEEVDSTWK